MNFSLAHRSFIKNLKHTEYPKVHKILLTGGPCAGKTTLLAKLQAILDNKGHQVYCVPEAATLMMTGGIQLDTSKTSLDYQVELQNAMLQMQMNLENVFFDMAEKTS